jgi:hypothetical protein
MSQDLKIVKVTWVDSSSVASDLWDDLEDIIEQGREKTAQPCISVGFLLRRGSDSLTLAAHLGDTDMDSETKCSGDMTIPMCAVQRIEELEVVAHGDGRI